MDAGDGQSSDRCDEVVRLCAAVRQASDDLDLDESCAEDLTHALADTESIAMDPTSSTPELLESVKRIRYTLLKSADGPLAPFLADAAAMIVVDGHGRLFF
jgi:hypothetical protein